MISLLLHESKAEPRTSVITMISFEYTGITILCPSVWESTEYELSSGDN